MQIHFIVPERKSRGGAPSNPRPTLALRWGYELGYNKRSQEIEALCTTLEAAEVKRRSLAEVSKVLRSLTLKFPGWLKNKNDQEIFTRCFIVVTFFSTSYCGRYLKVWERVEIELQMRIRIM